MLRPALSVGFVVVLAAAPAMAQGGPLCGNGTCDLVIEGCRDCPADCGVCGSASTSSCAPVGGAPQCGGATASCYCDYLCIFNGDCCLDVCLHCPVACGGGLPTCGNGTCEAEESCGSCPADCGACPTCGDLTCDLAAGESCSTCATDCGDCCGNTYCEADAGEDCVSCPDDCGACNTCGNGVCDGTPKETSTTCPPDCPIVCGDGHCDLTAESCSTCAQDCGVVVAGVKACPGTVTTPGEADLCSGMCGLNRDDCWCDAFCHEFADCCEDVCEPGNCPMLPGCTAVCPDGVCAPSEDCISCPQDCTWCPKCGDGLCQKSEVCKTVTGVYGEPPECEADCGKCCGNGVCDPDETSTNCDTDCPFVCGDGSCDPAQGETCSKCAEDCGVCCGDGSCNPADFEDCNNCVLDCGACQGPNCGNGVCDSAAGENCVSCPGDCTVCACNVDPVTIPGVAGFFGSVAPLKIGVEKTWEMFITDNAPFIHIDGYSPPPAPGHSKPSCDNSLIGLSYKVVPGEVTVESGFDAPKQTCNAKHGRTHSMAVGACAIGRKVEVEAAYGDETECKYQALCPSGTTTWQCNSDQYCCENKTAASGKLAITWPLGPKFDPKKFKLLKKLTKWLDFAAEIALVGALAYIDETIVNVGPTCSCTSDIDGNQRVELEIGGKGSASVAVKDSSLWKVDASIALIGCGSVGLNHGGCNAGVQAQSLTSYGFGVKIAIEFGFLGLIKIPKAVWKFPSDPSQYGIRGC